MNDFADLLGQPFVSRILQTALDNGRVASAYLFEGPPGCGKKTAATGLAAALVAGGDLNAQRRVRGALHPDVKRFNPAGVSYKVDQIREILRDASLKPVEGERRAFILDRAEALNDASSNALLKSIEEPPAGLTWILVSTQRARILPTIASRCQTLRFHPLDQQSLQIILQRELKADGPRAQDLAALSNGSVKLAAWFDSDDGKALQAQAEAFLEAAASGSLLARLDWAEAAGGERRELDRLLGLLWLLLRERWARAAGLPAELRLMASEPVHGRSLSAPILQQLMQAVARCRAALAQNANVGLALDELKKRS
jgi:DNA polymerase-3 subunit delta'